VLGSKVSPKEKVGATSVSSALEIALRQSGEVILGSAVALVVFSGHVENPVGKSGIRTATY
jgi:hypothetical protein